MPEILNQTAEAKWLLGLKGKTTPATIEKEVTVRRSHLQCIHKWVMRRNAGRLEVHWSFLHLWNQDDNGMASIRLGAVADKN